MGIMNRAFLQETANLLEAQPLFYKYARTLSVTITFKDDDSVAFMTFYNGTVVDVCEGPSHRGSDFYITATNENWRNMMNEPRFGIFEENGFGHLSLEGDIYRYCGNAMAFYLLWNTMKTVYLNNIGGLHDE